MSLFKTKLALIVLILVLAYLSFWPVPIRPQAWVPEPAPAETGVLAPNDRLSGLSTLGAESITGPEAIAIDDRGRLYSGLQDGRVVRIDQGQCEVLANTSGRPLGLEVLADQSVVVADALKGLLKIHPAGDIETLADQADGIRLNFADDLTVDSQGRIYFTDASWKFGIEDSILDAIEHAPNGRMLRYEPDSGNAHTLVGELYFANGITLGPDEDYVLINESSAYRVTRFWLKGARAGQREVFADNLPGAPDNITFNGRDRFWVALYSRRMGILDTLAPHPFWRSVMVRLRPLWNAMLSHREPTLLGLDLDGRIQESYQGMGRAAYGPLTSAIEFDGELYLGSTTAAGIGRISLSSLRNGGQAALGDEAISCPAN